MNNPNTGKARKLILATLASVVSAAAALAQTSPQQYVAPRPPMGWNSWNFFAGRISEKVVMDMADAMVSKGLRDAGYQYLVIDDTWQLGRTDRKLGRVETPGRDAADRIIPDPVKFPSGIKKLADYVHSKGLKFGIYTGPGCATCANRTGSLGYENIDLQTYAEWGVDYIKLDHCDAKEQPEVILKRWRTGLDALGRPMVLSINISHDFALTDKYADMWRTTTDIQPVWRFKEDTLRMFDDVYSIINEQVGLDQFQGNGRWNDPDMLQVGNGFQVGGKYQSLTHNENEAHFGMWAIFSAPLMLGNDLAHMTDEVRDIVANPEVIAINQDPAGVMGIKCKEVTPGLQVWVKPLWKIGDEAVAFLNATDESREIAVKLGELGITGPAFFRDAFARKDLGLVSDDFTAKLAPNSILLIKASAFAPVKRVARCLDLLDCSQNQTVRLEAEDARYQTGRWQTKYPGFSGKGYVIGENQEKFGTFRLNWDKDVETAGEYHVLVRYINYGKQDLVYRINGGSVVLKASAPGKQEWETASAVMKLGKGRVTIMLASPDITKNEVAVDYIELSAKP